MFDVRSGPEVNNLGFDRFWEVWKGLERMILGGFPVFEGFGVF